MRAALTRTALMRTHRNHIMTALMVEMKARRVYSRGGTGQRIHRNQQRTALTRTALMRT